MITSKNINLKTLTEEDALTLINGMAASIEFLFDALDRDGDGRLSPTPIDGCPLYKRLRPNAKREYPYFAWAQQALY
ncbi:MAG: hypothetical protein AAF633_08765 [Chloroflexota bacterium]